MTSDSQTLFNPFSSVSTGFVQIACLLILFSTTFGCSSENIDQAAGKPAAEVEAAVAELNESGAEIVLDSAGEVVAVKLPEKTTPEVIATLVSLSKLKRVDATETNLAQPAFVDLKSQNPQVEIDLPR